MRRLLGLGAASLLWSLIALGVQAQGLACIGKFASDTAEFDVCIYAEGAEKAGLLVIRGVRQSDAKSLALRAKEWNSLIGLWRKAAKVRSDEWKPVGSMKDKATDEPTRLEMTAGPGVQFLMTDREGIASFILRPEDYARFDLDLRNTLRYLAAHGPDD